TNASSDKSVMASPAVQALDLQMKLLSFIVTPSPITSLSMNQVYGHQFNYIYDSTLKQTDQLPRQTIPLQSIMRVRYMLHPYYFGKQWIMRAAIAYAPCGIVVLDIRVQVKFSISVETEIKNLKRYCIFKPNIYYNYIKGEKYGNKKPLLNYIAIVEMLKKSTQHSITSISQGLLGTEAGNNNIKQMEIKLKPPSLVPLLIASQKLTKMMQTLLDAGKILTQDEEELVFSHYAKQSNTSSLDEPILLFHTTGCFQTLIARGYSPSLLTSMQILDKNNIAVVADHEVLIYNLLPNSQHPHNWGLYRILKLTQKKLENDKRLRKKQFDTLKLGIVDKYKEKEEEEEESKSRQIDDEFTNIKINRTNIHLDIKGHPAYNLVLSIRIPTDDNFTFLLSSSIGLHTLYGGMHGQIMRRSSKYLSKMRQDCDEMSVFTAVTIDNASESREQIGKSEITQTFTAQLSYAAIRRLQEHQRRLDEQLQRNGTNQPNLADTSILNSAHTEYSLKRRSLLLERETNALMMSTHAITPINAMQILPEIPSFVMIQKSGLCQRSVPMRYEQLPLRDLSVMTGNLLQSQQNFGNIWIDNQIKLIQDYNSFEEQNWRKYVKKEIKNEIEEIGTLMLIPPHPIMHYVQPIFPVQKGRFIDGDLFLGLTPLPQTGEYMQARTVEPWQLRKCMALLAAESDIRRRWRLSERDRIRKQLNLPPPPDTEEADSILIDRRKMKEREMLINSAIASEQLIRETQHAQYINEHKNNQFDKEASDLIQKRSIFGDKSLHNESFINSFTSVFTQYSKFRSYPMSSPPAFLEHTRSQLSPDFINLELGLVMRQPFFNSLIQTMQPEFRGANAVLTSIAAGTLRQPIPIRSYSHGDYRAYVPVQLRKLNDILWDDSMNSVLPKQSLPTNTPYFNQIQIIQKDSIPLSSKWDLVESHIQQHIKTIAEQGLILDTEQRQHNTTKPATGRRAAATDIGERFPPELGDRSTGPGLNNRNTRRGTYERDNSITDAHNRNLGVRNIADRYLCGGIVVRTSRRSMMTRKSSYRLGDAQETPETKQQTRATDARIRPGSRRSGNEIAATIRTATGNTDIDRETRLDSNFEIQFVTRDLTESTTVTSNTSRIQQLDVVIVMGIAPDGGSTFGFCRYTTDKNYKLYRRTGIGTEEANCATGHRLDQEQARDNATRMGSRSSKKTDTRNPTDCVLPLLRQLQQQNLNSYTPLNPFYNQLHYQQVQGQQPLQYPFQYSGQPMQYSIQPVQFPVIPPPNPILPTVNRPQTQISEPRLPINETVRDQQSSIQPSQQMEQTAIQTVEKPRQSATTTRSVHNQLVPPILAYSQQQTSRIPLLPYTTERNQQQRQSQRSISPTHKRAEKSEDDDFLDEIIPGITIPNFPPHKTDIETAQRTWQYRGYDLVRDPSVIKYKNSKWHSKLATQKPFTSRDWKEFRSDAEGINDREQERNEIGEEKMRRSWMQKRKGNNEVVVAVAVAAVAVIAIKYKKIEQ
ncbi:MAG: hypothetical protein EZS28_012302, partial [Streblomastix strix]